VFADFDIDPDGRVYLVRISFDGYGCCTPEGEVTRIPEYESRMLLGLLDTDEISRKEIREVFYRYFEQNKNAIWRDALLEHELLAPSA
jgi:hypothetical protein